MTWTGTPSENWRRLAMRARAVFPGTGPVPTEEDKAEAERIHDETRFTTPAIRHDRWESVDRLSFWVMRSRMHREYREKVVAS